MKWVLNYLKGISRVQLCFGNNKFVLDGFKDVDMVGDIGYKKSTSELLIIFIGGVVYCQSKL